jgi:hypothetical protein
MILANRPPGGGFVLLRLSLRVNENFLFRAMSPDCTVTILYMLINYIYCHIVVYKQQETYRNIPLKYGRTSSGENQDSAY